MTTLLIALLLIVGVPSFSQDNRAAQPLRAIYLKDVDGDGKADELVYEIRRWKNDYEASLVITSATRTILWEHQWLMTEGDLSELIETEGDVTGKRVTLESWVRDFFVGSLKYGADFESRQLKDSDLRDHERLKGFAKYYGVTLTKLKTGILSQHTNSLFSYRAEWREDLNKLVYVPSIGKFVCYQRGY
ncbi:MAG: hypothetical protein ND895_06365 [Pyrinomonadaceae bacterium]|nr:hypothetical protein [Pyrinomonadaceae bacterium]